MMQFVLFSSYKIWVWEILVISLVGWMLFSILSSMLTVYFGAHGIWLSDAIYAWRVSILGGKKDASESLASCDGRGCD